MHDGAVTDFAPVRPPGSSSRPVDAAWLVDDLERWVNNEPLRALVSAFGDSRMQNGGLGVRLRWLEKFTAAHWDFRQGRERDYIEHVQLEPAVDALVIEAAASLGLRGSTVPSVTKYDHVLILGGLVRACVLRTRYAAQLQAAGLRSTTTTALTAFRPISEKERKVLAAIGFKPSVDNEVHAMEEGLVAAYGLSGQEPQTEGSPGDEGFATWLKRSWPPSDGAGPTVQLVVAPSPVPKERRANSADTYEFWADEIQRLDPGDSVLLVTSAIYVPYQGCDAVRMLALPRGVSVETVGLDNTDPEQGALRQTFRAPHYLQELRSTVRAAVNLYEAAEATVAG